MAGISSDLKHTFHLAACALALLPGLAWGQVDDEEEEAPGAAVEQTAPEAASQGPAALAPEPALVEDRVSLTPPEGVMPSVRRGFHVETDLGVFFTVGGAGGYSNAQTYLQLGVGYDLGERITLGAHFGMGSNAANCFGPADPRSGLCAGSENFTLSFIDGTASYLVNIADRVYLSPKVLAGWTVIDPAPVVLGQAGQGPASQAAVGAPNAGVGIGVEYATFMDHFSIGADATFRFVLGPNIPAFAIFPRVKYTF
jgi:hypothetical protein